MRFRVIKDYKKERDRGIYLIAGTIINLENPLQIKHLKNGRYIVEFVEDQPVETTMETIPKRRYVRRKRTNG